MSSGQRLGSGTQRYQPKLPADAGGGRQTIAEAIHPRVQAVMVAARFHGVELDPSEIVSTGSPSAPSLSAWAQTAGMWARAVRLRWRQLMRLVDAGPVVLLLKDGSATLMTGANTEPNVVLLLDPRALASEIALPIDDLRRERVWSRD